MRVLYNAPKSANTTPIFNLVRSAMSFSRQNMEEYKDLLKCGHCLFLRRVLPARVQARRKPYEVLTSPSHAK